MDIRFLKDHIIENNCISTILENLGCHHISHKNGYFSASNPDGDNPSAITVYENENLTTIDYTRNITENNSADIIDLVQFFQNCNFFNALKIICDWIDLDYYADPYDELPESLKITRLILEMSQGDDGDYEEKPLKPISGKILEYYKPWVNDLFRNDNINYDTQREFEVGYDDETNRITIPVRDELGTLVGVKGRLFKQKEEMSEDEQKYKYVYIEPCNRSKILFGLYKTYPYITREKAVYVTESEKGVMQLWSMGICNAVATCGKKVSQSQIEKLTRLCSKIIFLFDKDVKREELQELSEKFIDCIEIYAVIDTENVLNEKESPTDNLEKFNKLITECCERIR